MAAMYEAEAKKGIEKQENIEQISFIYISSF